MANRHPFLGSWALLCLLASLVLILGVLQYRWIGDVSRGERDRLRSSLQGSLMRVSRDFNARLSTAAGMLSSNGIPNNQPTSDEEYAARYEHWRQAARYSKLFRRVAIARPVGDTLVLRVLDITTGAFQTVDWPSDWLRARDRLQAKLSNGGGRGGSPTEDYTALVEVPHFGHSEGGAPTGELEWLLLEVDLNYVWTTLLPDLLHRHLGDTALDDYTVQVTMRNSPATPIYESDPAHRFELADADAAVNLFDFRFDPAPRFRRGPRGFSVGSGSEGGPRMQRPPEPPPEPPPSESPRDGGGRWRVSVRHHAGSLESVVAQTRLRNLTVGFAMLLLIIAAGAALLRYTRRAQKLAELQMEFVAGVSHELRTPLSVMRTAGYNLQGSVSNDAARVQRYGALVQQESERLSAVVEQILQFSNARAGRVIGVQSPVSIDQLIDDAIAAERRVISKFQCTLEKHVEDQLPPVQGDPVTLTHALQNLISNAAKYGNSGSWIGVSAMNYVNGGSPKIEIRIADRGPGIPAEELRQIFEPFYRGKKAIADQVHGTGLGLSLVKRIIEAHEGTISAQSSPGHGTEFLVRLPTATIDQNNVITNPAG